MENNFKEAAEKYATVITGAFLHQESMTTKDLSTKSFLAGCEHAAPKWIDVKERLPEFGKIVLCHCSIYGRYIGFYQQIDDTDWGNWSGMEQLGILPPTHWMPLPSSPPSIQKLNPEKK
jgi:hypothetical protein